MVKAQLIGDVRSVDGDEVRRLSSLTDDRLRDGDDDNTPVGEVPDNS